MRIALHDIITEEKIRNSAGANNFGVNCKYENLCRIVERSKTFLKIVTRYHKQSKSRTVTGDVAEYISPSLIR
jgi:hypothetical protein